MKPVNNMNMLSYQFMNSHYKKKDKIKKGLMNIWSLLQECQGLLQTENTTVQSSVLNFGFQFICEEVVLYIFPRF